MNETINQRIIKIRKKSGYTQDDVSKILGVHKSTYSRMERKGKINCQLAIKLAEIFKVDVTSILYSEDNDENEDKEQTSNSIGLCNYINVDNPPFIAMDRYERGTIIAMRSVSQDCKREIFTLAIEKLEEENDKLMQKNNEYFKF